MNTLSLSLRKYVFVSVAVSLAGSTAFADTILRKVPSERPGAARADGTTFGFVNLTAAQARTVYVSSGAELKTANKMVDGQLGSAFAFESSDREPTAVIDLGSVRSLNRVSTTYAARKGTMSFYVMNALPALATSTATADLPPTMKLDAQTLSQLKPVAVATNDGSQIGSSVDFAPASGRYVMLRWTPAETAATPFTIAEVSAVGDDQGRVTTHSRRRFNDVSDSKDVADTKDVVDTKDVPEEGPEAPPPGEGPPPSLPQPPPFTFIPQLVPVSL